MKNFILLDTDVIIDAARNESDAVNRLKIEEQKSTLQISSITEMELIVGCANKSEVRVLFEFLSRFSVARISEKISDKAIELLTTYRLSHGLLIPDAIIAATAIILDVSFISKNQKDFKFIDGLQLLKYP